MTEQFDDKIRDGLYNHESVVPTAMFDKISSRLNALDQSFDAALNAHITSYVSAVPANMFDDLSKRMDELDADFDADINNRLNNYTTDVPDGMWQRIMQEKYRRRPLAWWWAAALIFLTLAGGTIYYFGLQQNDAQQKLTSQNRENGNISAHNQNPASTNSTLTPKTINDLEQNSMHTNENKNPSISNISDKNHNPNSSGKSIEEGSYLPASEAKNSTKQHKGFLNEDVFVESGNFRNHLATDEPFLDETEQHQNSLRQLIRASINKVSPRQLLEAKLKNPVLPCPINGDAPRNDWYVDFYASPMMVFKNVTGKIAGKNIRTGMDSTLHKQVSFNAGISLVKNIGENFLVKAGVQYNQVNEVFRSTRVNEIKLITTVTIRTVILSPGDTIYIRDTSVIQQIGTVTRQTQNRYKSWDIPIIIGYEFGGKDLRLNANAGIIANINSSYKGDMLDTAQQTINIAGYKNAGVYKTKIGLSIYAGLGIVKSLGNRTDLLIEPHARINLANTTTEAAWFKQKNITAGLSVGVRYKLNGTKQR